MSETIGPVLIAYDGSESSATAIAAAGPLLPGREALVCHAWAGLSRAVLGGAAAELDRVDLREAEKVAARGVELARTAGFDATPLLVRDERRTWRGLLDAAEGQRASLIVAGAHGMSGLGRAVLGSVSTALIHHSRVPVLVVPSTSLDEAADGPLLLCYDGSAGARRAIGVAGPLFGPRPALVLHFWESWVAEAPALAGLSGSVAGMAVELDELADERSAHLTEDGVELADRSGFEATGLSERATGPGWMAVRDTADEHSCAAIVIGSRGLTGVSAALGSVSNGVVHNSRRPVLVVPAQEDE